MEQTIRTTQHAGGFSVRARLHDDLLALHIAGELDMATVPYVQDTIDPYRASFSRVALMLEDLDFVDGFGLRHLLELFDGATTVILNPSGSVHRLLGILDIPVGDVSDVEDLLTSTTHTDT